MTDIADYDSTGYDYTKYWDGREYENIVEQRALKSLLPKEGGHLLDVGGSFGRLSPIYTKRFKQATILDYSHIALRQAEDAAKQQGINNLNLVHGDAYRMPFNDNTFDTTIIIRVMHHIEHPEILLSEINRVTKPDGILILEMANKIHLKARLKHLVKGDLFSFIRDTTPIRLGDTSNPTSGIFYNFHPDMMLQLMESSGFRIIKQLSVSNLRIPPSIKHIIPTIVLTALDELVQPIFTTKKLGPSIWFKAKKITL